MKVHDSHHTEEGITACGRRWTALSPEAQSGPVTCRACQRNLKAFWATRN